MLPALSPTQTVLSSDAKRQRCQPIRARVICASVTHGEHPSMLPNLETFDPQVIEAPGRPMRYHTETTTER